MTEFDIKAHFNQFEKNLRTSDDNIRKIAQRTKTITKIINQSYWNNESEKLHSLLVGSYGRGTAIHLSDIDLLVELPSSQKERFEDYISNGQSALLQDIKQKLSEHYSTSTIKADGQIVSIEFSDSIKFEILPSFTIKNSEKYEYPDSHNGGTWKETDPKLEQVNLTNRNKNFKSIVKKFCRMQRAWNDQNNVGLSGIAIDSLIYLFFEECWDRSKTSYIYFDFLSRDFYQWLINFINTNRTLLSLDNSYMLDLNNIAESKATTAYNRTVKAIEKSGSTEDSEIEWIKIYGDKFPVFEESYAKPNNHLNYISKVEYISSRENRPSIGLANDTEQFANEIWDISVEQLIDIKTDLQMNGFRKGNIKNFLKIPIKPNSKIIFSVNKLPNIEWYWKVRNVGNVANSKNCIRGQIKKHGTEISEPISFKGAHYVEVYGVSSGIVKIFGRIDVPLESSI